MITTIISVVCSVLGVTISTVTVLTKFGQTNATKADLKSLTNDISTQVQQVNTSLIKLENKLELQGTQLQSLSERVAVLEYAQAHCSAKEA